MARASRWAPLSANVSSCRLVKVGRWTNLKNWPKNEAAASRLVRGTPATLATDEARSRERQPLEPYPHICCAKLAAVMAPSSSSTPEWRECCHCENDE